MPGLEQFLRAIPKVELHCHLYGSVRKDTFSEMAARVRAPLTPIEIDAFYTRARKPFPTNNVLRALDEHLVRQAEDLYRITLECLEDFAAHNVRYSEFFWNPNATVAAGVSYPDAQAGIVRAIRDAEVKFGIVGRLVPAIDRERPPAAAMQMVQWVIDHRQPEVIGIGIDFMEANGPPGLFVEAYAAARRAGLRATAHAGENGMPWKNVKDSIELLGAERIDHGYTVIDSPDYARQCAERAIVFTVVPTNSFYLRTLPDERWALDHPIRKMPELGLHIHPNTDNPTLHKVTPTKAWTMMAVDFGFGLDDLRGFMLNGLDAAWIDDSLRRKWKNEWLQEFDALRDSLQPG
jgi:adenosine deaminase